jgi:hypothetical protein
VCVRVEGRERAECRRANRAQSGRTGASGTCAEGVVRAGAREYARLLIFRAFLVRGSRYGHASLTSLDDTHTRSNGCCY